MDAVPIYHSLPGAPAALYLDFDGHFEPVWGEYRNIATPIYDSNGNAATFNVFELAFIENVWKIVAEDFAPFNIDVTTEEPPVLREGVPSHQANGVALRVAIGGSKDDWYHQAVGGVAFRNSFTDLTVNTAYAFTVFDWGVSTDPLFVGGTVSHEAGHAFGLAHQSQYNPNGVKVEEYLPPVGSWAAIMGSHGYLDHATWHNGQSSAGATVYQDDIAIIGGSTNRFGFRPDDHGATLATATPLNGTEPYWTGSGFIGQSGDLDMFSFTTAAPHDFNIAVDGNSPGQNLDAVLELYDAQGRFMASPNLDDSLDAFIQRSLTAGTYFIGVRSNGQYGRIGQFSLNVWPTARISIGDVSIIEGNAGLRNATFVVTLSDPVNEQVTVSFNTFSDTAKFGEDYVAQGGTLTFWPGITTQTVIVPVWGDTVVEPDEQFFVRLSNVVNATLADEQAIGTVINDDVPFAVSSDEQLFVYLLNRARNDPVAYQREQNLPVDLSYVLPQPPLAVNESLFASARFHADEMATWNYFEHQSAISGNWPNKMARDHGYELPAHFSNNENNIESISAGTFRDMPQEVLDAFIIDAGVPSLGHRNHLLGIGGFDVYREIGVGHSFNTSSDYDHYWGVHAASTRASDRFLTGVVFDDRNNNRRYDLNEGLSGVLVSAGVLSTATNTAGGWTIEVPSNGAYLVTVRGGQFRGAANAFVVETANNVEVDFISGRSVGIVNFDETPQIVAPTDLSASVQAPNRVRLTWTDNSPNDTGFRIERSSPGLNFSTLIDLPANVTSYDDVGLQSFVTYSYRVRALSGLAQSDPSNVASARPQLITITGTGGHDTYHVVRAGSQLHVYENALPVGRPTYFSELIAMTGTLTIDAGAGNDVLMVNTDGQPTLGVGQLNYNAGTGANSLLLERGSARIDSSVALGGTLITTVQTGSHLSTGRLNQDGLTLGANGRVTVLPGGIQANVLSAMDLGTTGTLDLNDNDLVVKTTAAGKDAVLNTLYGRLISGFAAGAWNGNGLASSVAQSNAATTVSIVDNALLSYTEFSGELVDPNSILIKHTYYGDIDLNGQVDADDLTVFASNFGRTNGATQVDGDVDFNGTVDADDLTVFANNFGKGVGMPLATGAPEGARPSVVISLREMEHASSRGARRLHLPTFAAASGVSDSTAFGTKVQPRSWPNDVGSSPSDDETLLDLLADAIAGHGVESGETLADARLVRSNRFAVADAIWTDVLWS